MPPKCHRMTTDANSDCDKQNTRKSAPFKSQLEIVGFWFGVGGGSLSLRYRSTDLRFAPATLPFGRGFSCHSR